MADELTSTARIGPQGTTPLAAWLDDQGEEGAFCVLADALDHWADKIPPECQYHGRDHVQANMDGGEYCAECVADEWSGELCHFAGDTLAEAIIAEIKRRVQP